MKNYSRVFALTLLLSLPQLVVAEVAPLPGLSTTEMARMTRLRAIYQRKVGTYTVHTQHLNSDGSPKYVNALITEDSPYLKQHVHNPVNWFPWGAEAFTRAKAENKPIFLSIGYSTCHWCHVMARESFDDEQIAEILNRHFISIKVDREQHPDIDEIYMTGVQLISGRGGWPMSSFLTPEGNPFFGATYYPPQQFIQLLQRIEGVWRNREGRLREDADTIRWRINQLLAVSEAAEISPAVLEQAVSTALTNYDVTKGGFSSAPKFPNESLLLFFLNRLRRADIPSLQTAVEHTLHKMAQGGLYDQIGGGFHRYSVDSQWLVPHFEKMLYNQALLARVYSEAYQLTGEAFYSYIVRETLDYVIRDMRDANGCFYSATDADSEEEEGLFFVWTPQQLDRVLNESDAEWVKRIYGVSEQGNFEHRNILHLPYSYQEIAAREQLPVAKVYQRIVGIRQQLVQYRELRIHPLRDEKVITAWSAMMATAMVQGALALSDNRYLQTAEQCAEYLYQHHWNERDKQLWRIGWQGESSVAAVQEDYAYLIEALIALFDATADKKWLTRAQRLTDQMIAGFWDSRQGGFFAGTESTATPNIVRAKSTGDGAIPSGNSVALGILDQLWSRTGEFRYSEYFTQTLAAVAGGLNQYPLSATYTLSAINNHQSGESGDLVYFADGHIAVRLLSGDGKNRFRLQLAIDETWHINADHVLQKELIPTSVRTTDQNWQVDQLVFPQADEISLDFQPQSLLVLQGQTSILGQARRQGESTGPLRLQLTLQACDNSHCLAPQTRTLVLRM